MADDNKKIDPFTRIDPKCNQVVPWSQIYRLRFFTYFLINE